MSEKQAIIVIPVYTTQLTVSEHAALRQCFDILSSYPKCFVKPESLDITSLVRDYPANHIVPFPDTYFKGIAGYNRLMMSPEFYETFAQWEYILIYPIIGNTSGQGFPAPFSGVRHAAPTYAPAGRRGRRGTPGD